MQGPDYRFDTSLYSFESASGAETIGRIEVTVGASQKVKSASEGFEVGSSVTDQPSETQREDIMRWEGGRAWLSERLIEWERAAMEEIEGRMEGFGIWGRERSEGIGSG
jgi:hypothetical protein